jgi:hypothetical protein
LVMDVCRSFLQFVVWGFHFKTFWYWLFFKSWHVKTTLNKLA